MNYKYLKYEYASTVNGKQHRYEILDLSTYNRGLYKNDAMFDEHIKWGELFFLVYSITDRESFKAGLKLGTYFISNSLVQTTGGSVSCYNCRIDTLEQLALWQLARRNR